MRLSLPRSGSWYCRLSRMRFVAVRRYHFIFSFDRTGFTAGVVASILPGEIAVAIVAVPLALGCAIDRSGKQPSLRLSFPVHPRARSGARATGKASSASCGHGWCSPISSLERPVAGFACRGRRNSRSEHVVGAREARVLTLQRRAGSRQDMPDPLPSAKDDSLRNH